MEKEFSVFEQLAASLPPEERKSLLQKITNSLHLHDKKGEFVKKEITREELEKKVHRDIQLSGWWERLIIRLYTFFTGRNPVDFFLKRSLGHLKHRLNSVSGVSYFDGSGRKLSRRLADEIYSLYVLTAPLRKVFRKIWSNTDFIENVYTVLLRESIHSCKIDIHDFVPLEEMESIFAATGDKNQIRKKLISRMNEYLNSIPGKSTGEISEIFLPFYFGKFLAVFPFKKLLTTFGCSVEELSDFRNPSFSSIEFSLVSDMLEQLLYCVNLFSLIDWKDACINTVGGIYFQQIDNVESDGLEDKLQILKKQIKTLDDGVEDFLKGTPLLDIIRYMKNDSYYEMILRTPRPDFFEFYASALKIRVLSDFAAVFQDVRRQYINMSIERIFSGFTLYQLSGYREYRDFDYKTLNLPYFKHISSLTLLNNFFSQYYRAKIADVFDVLYKVVLVKSPQLQTRILELQKEVDKIVHDINSFDRTLWPEHEDGKNFIILRSELKKSPALERKYRSLIGEKDLSAERLIFSGLDVLSNIRKGLELVISSPADHIRLQLSSVYPQVDREHSMREVVKVLLGDVTNLNTLLTQNLQMEKN